MKQTEKRDNSTPRPWGIEGNDFSGFKINADEGQLVIANLVSMAGHGDEESNAALIVRAVNAHDKLVSALEAAAEALDKYAPPAEMSPYADSVADEIKAALKLAKGGMK